jgi:hypothetical protein
LNRKRMLVGCFLLAVMGLASMARAQSAITQTTLASAMDASTPSLKVASNSGITIAQNGQAATLGLIDTEVVGFLFQTALPSQPTVYSILRGQMGTKAASHASGQMVLIQTNARFGGFSLPIGGFQSIDPPLNGTCPSGGLWINVTTAAQWLCSSVTGTWVPGWHNPLASSIDRKVTAAVASAAGLVTPSGPLFHITGALAITGFNIPVGFNATAVGGGGFCAIPDGTFTTTTANNIALASTAVVNKTLCWTWDATNQKFTPSY